MSTEITTVIYFFEGPGLEGAGEGVESFKQCVKSHRLINSLWS